MKSRKNIRSVLGALHVALLIAAVAACGGVFAQKATPRAPEPQSRIVLAINEGGAANADATETLFRYQEFADVVEKALRTQIVIVAVRDRNKLLAALKKHEYPLLLARPADVPAQAIRDFGYQPVVSAKEPFRALFIVPKYSVLKTINDG